jgi:hypothetical protein
MAAVAVVAVYQELRLLGVLEVVVEVVLMPVV